MKDQPSNSTDKSEPVRPKTIPDDFIWDAEGEYWYPPGEPCRFDHEAYSRELDKTIEEVKREPPIPEEELWITWVPEAPAKRRKQRRDEPDLFSNLPEDADPSPNEPCEG